MSSSSSSSWLAALVLVAAVALPAAAGALELEGTWHVLVHYKDSATNKPDQERWEDRLWVIEEKGTRLEWSEYPIVVFDDSAGRFERLGTNRQSRVLGYWEPNPGQRAQIRSGLEFNTRGSKKKTLRAKDGGWTSARGGGGYESARFITYSETWSIRGTADLPRFVREDSLGAASAEEFSGQTVYETTAVESNGDVLVGRFERDGTRSGTFRLTRSGAASTVKGSGKTQGERVYEAFFGQAAGQLLYSGAIPDGDAEKELRRRAEAGELTEEDRKEVRKRFEDSLTEIYRSQGNDPRAHRADIVKLARKMERAYLDDGKTIEEIQQMIASGALRP